MNNVERTGWRDEGLSARHRIWGKDLLMTDIDFLVVEAAKNTPVAIVEYKNEKAAMQTIKNWQYQVLINLANLCGLPLFNVRYAVDYSVFTVTPLNGIGIKTQAKKSMTEIEYVIFLYQLRDMVPPATLDICAEIGWELAK